MIYPVGGIANQADVFECNGRYKENDKNRNHKNTFEKNAGLVYSP
jgi:hypothetical protein